MLTAIAFDQAYRDYSRALTGYARAVTGDSADAEDVAQDAWIEAWKGRAVVEVQGLWSWLRRVVKRVWWHRLNRAGQKRDGIAVPIEAADNVAVEGAQEVAADRAQIAEAIDTLTVRRGQGGKGVAPASASVKSALRHALNDDDSKPDNMTRQGWADALKRGIAALRIKWRIE